MRKYAVRSSHRTVSGFRTDTLKRPSRGSRLDGQALSSSPSAERHVHTEATTRSQGHLCLEAANCSTVPTRCSDGVSVGGYLGGLGTVARVADGFRAGRDRRLAHGWLDASLVPLGLGWATPSATDG